MCYAFSGDFMFAEYLRTDEIVFKHALGCRDVFGKEFHVFNELFLLLGDGAKFTSDRLISEIHANTLVVIPKNQFHQFDHIGAEEKYHRYVLQFDLVDNLDETVTEVFDCVKLIHNVDPHTMILFSRLDELIKDNKSQGDKEKLLKAIFTEILMDLKYNYNDIINSVIHTNNRTRESPVEFYGRNTVVLCGNCISVRASSGEHLCQLQFPYITRYGRLSHLKAFGL